MRERTQESNIGIKRTKERSKYCSMDGTMDGTMYTAIPSSAEDQPVAKSKRVRILCGNQAALKVSF
jgi:hypothetical protein